MRRRTKRTPLPPPEAAVRRARPGDAAALARLRYDFRSTLDAPVEARGDFVERCSRWIETRLAADGAWRCWVVERGGAIVGMIWLQLVEKLPNPVGEATWHAYVTSFYVEPSSRGQGAGSHLLEAALRACEAERVDAVFLWPTRRSRSLYERYGFAVRDDLLERRLGLTPQHSS